MPNINHNPQGISLLTDDGAGVVQRELRADSSSGLVVTHDEGSITFDASALSSSSSAKLPLAGGTLTGALNMGSNQINAVAAPSVGTDAANKTYVDGTTKSLTSQVTGVLPVANGGTNTALLTNGTATFATAASVDVTDATITASSIIVVTEVGASAADRYSVSLTPGSKFTIHSSNSTSAATVNYIRLK